MADSVMTMAPFYPEEANWLLSYGSAGIGGGGGLFPEILSQQGRKAR